MTVITFGTFDLLHIGHVRLLTRAASLGDRLVVGVSTDALSISKKGKAPVFPERDRMEIVGALGCVSLVFPEESLEQKREYVLYHQARILVMGEDWNGRFDALSDICDVRYLPRTAGISTTEIVANVAAVG